MQSMYKLIRSNLDCKTSLSYSDLFVKQLFDQFNELVSSK